MTKTKLSSNPSLPDDLVVSILARVSRLYYPSLSLISKSFRSLLASPEIYKARSLLGTTESCLYVCLRCHGGYRWFTLCRKPKKSSGYVLATVPIPTCHEAHFCSLVAVGSEIYNIDQYNYHASSYSVMILDCRSHTLREAPSLPVKHLSVSASVLDRKIYAAGCYMDTDSDSLKNFLEVFDTETQVWNSEPIPCNGSKDSFLYSKSTCIDGKFHVMTSDHTEGVVAYNSKEGRWDRVGQEMRACEFSDSFCQIIENVLYCVSKGTLVWYDTEVRTWRGLEGLVGLPSFSCGVSVRLADYGGKLAVFWDEDPPFSFGFDRMKKIWCAVIALERCKRFAISGKVEWLDHVLTIPSVYHFVKVLSATL